MNKYISIEARHVAALILVKVRSGIRTPVMQNVKLIQFILPRRNKYSLPPGLYRKVLAE